MSPTNTPPPASPGHRIAKLLARAGVASRREIERMLAEGRIALDGKTLDTPATILTSLAGVTVDGHPVAEPAAARLFRYHKSAGTLTAERDFTGRQTIYDQMPEGLPRVMPVGRLDLNTEGLLLLTTDGELKRQLELPASGVERSYRARAYGHVTQEQLEDLMLGVEIEGVRYGPINANIERRTGANLWIEMTLTEGKNREVRRVLEYLGLQVSRLIRTRYGPFWLADLPVGDVDEIRASDLNTFRTVLTKSGGKTASNLQFAVRQRVFEAPKPVSIETPRGNKMRREPERSQTRSDRAPRVSMRVTPERGEQAASAPLAARGDRSTFSPRTDQANPRSAPARTGRLSPRFQREDHPDLAGSGQAPWGESHGKRSAPRQERGPGRPGRPSPYGSRAGRGEEDSSRTESTRRFTPRVTPERRDAPERQRDGDPIKNNARAARAREHRDSMDPRAPRAQRPGGASTGRPTKGPADGRGRPPRPDKPRGGPRSRKP